MIKSIPQITASALACYQRELERRLSGFAAADLDCVSARTYRERIATVLTMRRVALREAGHDAATIACVTSPIDDGHREPHPLGYDHVDGGAS